MLKRAALKSTMGILALSGAIFGSSLVFAEDGTPFSQLSGTWKGSGQVRYADGRNERLSCRGYYTQKGGGSELTLAIRCQSDANKIEMRGVVAYKGGRVSGHWEERTFNAEGELSGSASANKLALQIGGQVKGTMSVSVSGGTHQVAISTGGVGFKGVSITFSRG
jgi:hypothetical protein